MTGWPALLTIILLSLFTEQYAQSASLPVCTTDTGESNPQHAAVGELPAVASWSDLHELPDNCHIALQAPAALTVALAGKFVYSGTVNDLAARLGAISKTKGLRYWSVSDDEWKTLVSDASALKSPDADALRADFTSTEILSGQTLYFAQDDTRSWGSNVFGVNVVDSSADSLVFRNYNVSTIRMGPIKLVGSEDAQSVLLLERLDDSTWQYYSLAVIKRSALAAREKSLINRQYAFYRFLTEQKTDADPPLAP